MRTHVDVSALIGKTITEIEQRYADNELIFVTNENEWYKMYHDQNCCECVEIESIAGNLDDLLDSPILMAEAITNNNHHVDHDKESFTWTFYKFATAKGFVTIRWYGESNGYYSEEVDFVKIDEQEALK